MKGMHLSSAADRVSRPRALVSVADKTGIADLSKSLKANDWEIIASGGTAEHLREVDIEVTSVSEITGFPEILSGRVKTLHPKIFGGILADRKNQEHLYDLVRQQIMPVEMVVCNFYPFEQQPSVEMIDIGGPSMVRAAAKNHESVVVVVSPSDYACVRQELEAGGDVSLETRKLLARKAFETTKDYDTAVADWLAAEMKRQR